MGSVQFVLSPHVLVDAMVLSALMVASVLKVTGSSALMVVSMMDGSDGRTQQSNLMVVGKIGGGIRWFGWLQNRGWLQNWGGGVVYGWKGK